MPSKLGGKRYRQVIASHVAKTLGAHGVEVYEEVDWGSSIIGKRRRVDILVLHKARARAIALQAKYQESIGTTDEKIPYAIEDCAAMWVPAVVVYSGTGWSSGVLHLLRGSRHAVSCEVDSNGAIVDSSELDAFLAQQFGVWDVPLRGKKATTAT